MTFTPVPHPFIGCARVAEGSASTSIKTSKHDLMGDPYLLEA